MSFKIFLSRFNLTSGFIRISRRCCF